MSYSLFKVDMSKYNNKKHFGMKKLILLLMFIPPLGFGQDDSSESEVVKEPVVRNEFSIKITDLSNIESGKTESEYSIIVYKNNEVFQNIKTIQSRYNFQV